jgi:hypothetical protein
LGECFGCVLVLGHGHFWFGCPELFTSLLLSKAVYVVRICRTRRSFHLPCFSQISTTRRLASETFGTGFCFDRFGGSHHRVHAKRNSWSHQQPSYGFKVMGILGFAHNCSPVENPIASLHGASPGSATGSASSSLFRLNANPTTPTTTRDPSKNEADGEGELSLFAGRPGYKTVVLNNVAWPT